jgi:hypothetical protein
LILRACQEWLPITSDFALRVVILNSQKDPQHSDDMSEDQRAP